jgi:catalase
VNAPRIEGGARNYGRDGTMRFDGNGRRAKNYEPNSYDGPAQLGGSDATSHAANGSTGTYVVPRHDEDDDFVQASALYRVMSEGEKQRLITNLAGSLAQVTRPDVIERSIAHFRNADADYGARLEAAVKAIRG